MLPFSISSLEAREAHEELKSFGVVSVEHDESCGSEGDAIANEALNTAAHADCSNFILNCVERDGSRIVLQD